MVPRYAFTLVEMIVVLMILAALSSVVAPLLSQSVHDANRISTQTSLTAVRDALVKYWSDTKHLPMDGITTSATESNRLDIDWLFRNPTSGDQVQDFDPNTKIGWRGRYLNHSTGDEIAAGKWLIVDAWNTELVVQDVAPSSTPRDVRIVSAGSNGVVDTPGATATDLLTVADTGDDLYVVLSLR